MPALFTQRWETNVEMLQLYLNMRSKGVTLCEEVMDADTSVARVAGTVHHYSFS